MQSPYLVQCLQLHEVDPLSIDELPNPIHEPAGIDKLFRWERAWTSQGQKIVEGRSFNCPSEQNVRVVPCVWFAGSEYLVSESAGMPWEEFAG
eukprot:3755679-Amphidinium_carterae.1